MSQLRNVTPVSLDVALELPFPIGHSRFWNPAVNASLVLMPETAVDENDLSAGGKHQVGNSG